MRLLLVFSLLFIVSCQDTNSNSFDQLSYGQPDIEIPTGTDDSGNPVDPAVLRFQLASNVLSTKCINCHTGFHASWSSFTTEEDWKSSGRVTAGSATSSTLFNRLTGCGGSSSGMPPSPASPIASEECDYIQEWIDNLE